MNNRVVVNFLRLTGTMDITDPTGCYVIDRKPIDLNVPMQQGAWAAAYQQIDETRAKMQKELDERAEAEAKKEKDHAAGNGDAKPAPEAEVLR